MSERAWGLTRLQESYTSCSQPQARLLQCHALCIILRLRPFNSLQLWQEIGLPSAPSYVPHYRMSLLRELQLCFFKNFSSFSRRLLPTKRVMHTICNLAPRELLRYNGLSLEHLSVEWIILYIRQWQVWIYRMDHFSPVITDSYCIIKQFPQQSASWQLF